MIKSVGDILTSARRETDNLDATSTSGISTEELLDYINAAKDRIYSLIISEHAQVFDVTTEIDLVANTFEYSLPENCFIGNKVSQVEYSYSGQSKDYCTLKKLRRENIHYQTAPYVSGFDVRNGKIVVSPTPSLTKGKLRVTYPKRYNRLDIKRATIQSSADDGTSFIAITINDDLVINDAEDYNEEFLSQVKDSYICAHEADGTPAYLNLKYTAYSSAGKLITLDSGQLLTGGTIPMGGYLTFGKYSTSHSELEDLVERYLRKYVVWNILKRESSVDAAEALQELAGMSEDIVEVYGKVPETVEDIPILDDYFTI